MSDSNRISEDSLIFKDPNSKLRNELFKAERQEDQPQWISEIQALKPLDTD